MSSNNFKPALFSQFARVGKAMSNGNHLELLEFIAQGERSVDELAKISGLTVANTSASATVPEWNWHDYLLNDFIFVLKFSSWAN